MEKKIIIIGGLTFLLIILAGYIIMDKYLELRERENIETFRQAYTQGVIDTITSLIKQTENCNPTTINFGNFTREIVDKACINKEQ